MVLTTTRRGAVALVAVGLLSTVLGACGGGTTSSTGGGTDLSPTHIQQWVTASNAGYGHQGQTDAYCLLLTTAQLQKLWAVTEPYRPNGPLPTNLYGGFPNADYDSASNPPNGLECGWAWESGHVQADITKSPSAYEIGSSCYYVHYMDGAAPAYDNPSLKTVESMIQSMAAKNLGGPVPTPYSQALGNYSLNLDPPTGSGNRV